MDVQIRIALEKFIYTIIIDDATALGYQVSVNNGEETIVKRETNRARLLGAMFSTDEDQLYFYNSNHKEEMIGWVYLIYGNSGYDVISNYADNEITNKILARANSVYNAYHNGKLKLTFSLIK